jgi:class 3 adenylate cyclase
MVERKVRIPPTKPGDFPPWANDLEPILGPLHDFIKEIKSQKIDFDRVLSTVLFTDIVDSTSNAVALGDRDWRLVLEKHHATVRTLLARYRGVEVDTAGDGFFATFDGPARAVRCAQAIVEAVRPLGMEIRAGVHTGEVETIAGKVGGLAVVIGARVGALAHANEVLATSTVKDLTTGSGLGFEDIGSHELKGIPERWHLYRVESV